MKFTLPKVTLVGLTSLLLAGGVALAADDKSTPAEKSFEAPYGMKVAVKMIGPYAQPADLQIICAFKHKSKGDSYFGAMKDLDVKLGGLLSSLRNRGEFTGELGETILFTPPAGSMVAKRMLVIGLGPEQELSLETLRIVGRVAVRQAVALKATHVAFAPVIRDQGNSTIDVGEGDRAVIENIVLAYDTEKRLQGQNLSPSFNVESWTIEAGPSYFAGAAKDVEGGIANAGKQISERNSSSYSTVK